MRSRRPVAGAAIIAFALVAAILLPASAHAAEPREYAYLFLQGRITDPSGRAPEVGATVRVSNGADEFEAVTDRRGVFVFDRLPVSSYEIEVTTAGGRPVRGARQIAPLDPDRTRIAIDTNPGNESRILLDGREGTITVLNPPLDHGKLWKEVLIFVGAAAILAI